MLRALTFTTEGNVWRFDARLGETGPSGSDAASVSHVVGTIGADGAIGIIAQEPSGPPPCPICLARGTRIATPAGVLPVEALRAGDPVWTIDELGRRIPATVVQVGSTPVPDGQ